MKQKITFTCTSCEYQAPKWLGCCPGCQAWNTLEQSAYRATTITSVKNSSAILKDLSAITTTSKKRFLSGIKEWDRVVGGGIMPGAFMMLTGDPGIGKSTLLLQIAHHLAQTNSVIYFSSEESLEQLKQRAERLRVQAPGLLFSDNAHLTDIVITAQQQKPDLVIIDSIQNCYLTEQQSLPGSIGQLREAAFTLMRLAKEHSIAVLTSGHITKEGLMAGPKTLEHMVDAVFYLQGEERWQIRMLRSVKNRFGTVSELGFFEMLEEGLQELPNINAHLLEDVSGNPGSALTSFMEGSRPLLVELQALTITTKYPSAQRVISGIEYNQVVLIAAILEKHLRINFSNQDIFFKVSGGFKIKSSGADLAIALALLSSYFQKPLPEKTLVLGEISLTGQIKPVNGVHVQSREAEKFGIVRLTLARNQKIDQENARIVRCGHVYDLLELFS